MQLTKISLADQARDALLEAIVSGKLPAGSRLTEESLCAEFAISRTPVRDALLKLEADGLIERLSSRGYQVKKLDREAVEELLSCRLSVEMQIFLENCDNIFQEGLQELYDELLQLDHTCDDPFGKARSIDDALHNIINDSCTNRYWREIHARLLKQRLPYRDMRNKGDEKQLLMLKNERLQLLEAILSGDKTRGAAALQSHLEKGKQDVLSALKNNS
jgi:DNA-binding GntR family transcriptional regulator